MWSLRSVRPAGADRAASPLVGNLLLVGVVVVVGGLLAVFAFGFLVPAQSPPPQAVFDGEFTDSGELTLRHTHGETVPAKDIVFRVRDADGTRTLGTWKVLDGRPSDVSAGDALTVAGFNGDETVLVVWNPTTQDRSQILSRFETRSIPTTTSSASVSAPAAGQWVKHTTGWQGTAWQAVGRAGTSDASGGDAEVEVTERTGSGSSDTAQYTWQNGQPTNFTLTFNQNGNDEGTLEIGGKRATFTNAAFTQTGDTIGLTLKDTPDSTIEVSDLRLNGQRLSRDSLTTDGNGDHVSFTITEATIADGFVLTGTTTFSWTGAQPERAAAQMNFEIEQQ